MKINITENELKKLIHLNIKKLIKESNEFELNISPMDKLKSECEYLIKDIEFYNAIITRIPNNTENIINNVTEKLNELCQCTIISFNYNENELIIVFEGDFSSIEGNQEYISNGNELFEYITDYLGAYNNINYGGEGILKAIVRSVDFIDRNYNKLNVNLSISPYINPYFLSNKIKY